MARFLRGQGEWVRVWMGQQGRHCARGQTREPKHRGLVPRAEFGKLGALKPVGEPSAQAELGARAGRE